jgi:hypothetical protein
MPAMDLVLHAKDPLDPRVLVREAELIALWDGAQWRLVSRADAEVLIEVLVPVRGKNVRREIIMRARRALQSWE